MKRERLFYLDFVRAIAAIAIVITHFNARYLYLDPPAPEKTVLTTNVGNLYIGDWGVSLFFIISGAALMYVYEEKCELKKFYKKRFFSIYPMFWIAYAVVFVLSVWRNHGMIGAGIPKWRLVFSLFGFDGLLMANGYPTFYLLGEWFLGVIILIYLIFPLLRKLMNEKPLLLLAASLICYVAGLLVCSRIAYPIAVPTVLFIRIPELVFGMFFVKYHWKSNWKTAVAAFLVIVANGLIRPEISSSIQTTYVGIASFLVLVYLSDILECPVVRFVCGKLSKYSYAIFLVHHVVIANIMERISLQSISVWQSYLLFVVICCVIAICAGVLYFIHGRIMALCTKKQRS